ncbi:MAG: E3 binding domain-containing protein, partial [Gammaproteobacteria bacterium]|nr:E3 binding domain-containing protein [Gammaproteobacteria bacterium]
MADKKTIKLPDVGDFDDIEIIEVLVGPGDEVEADQGLIVLESDKATMEIPSPYAGTIEKINVSVGDRINEGDEIAILVPADGAAAGAKPEPDSADATAGKAGREPEPGLAEKSAGEATQKPVDKSVKDAEDQAGIGPGSSADDAPAGGALGKERRPHPGADGGGTQSSKLTHASPSIRRYARELGVDLQLVVGSGPKGRILKPDVKGFIKSAMPSGGGAGGGIAVGGIPEVDHSKFGEVETVPLGRIKKISGAHLHRSWVNIP